MNEALFVDGGGQLFVDSFGSPSLQVKQHHRLVGALEVADDVSGMEGRWDIKPHVLEIAGGARLVPLAFVAVIARHYFAVRIE